MIIVNAPWPAQAREDVGVLAERLLHLRKLGAHQSYIIKGI